VSEEEINAAKACLTKAANEWKKRKRACMDIIEMICDSSDQDPRQFMAGLGLETDEEMQVNVKDILNL